MEVFPVAAKKAKEEQMIKSGMSAKYLNIFNNKWNVNQEKQQQFIEAIFCQR